MLGTAIAQRDGVGLESPTYPEARGVGLGGTSRTSRRGFTIATDLFSIPNFATEIPRRIKIMPYGDWDNPAYGKWHLDQTIAQDFVRHFDERVLQIDVKLNLEHQAGPAPGWIQSLEAADDGLYATIEWTKFGESLLSDSQYRYVSPEWFWEWERASDEQVFEHVLHGLALTNTPFFKELPAIQQQGTDPVMYLGQGPADAPANGGFVMSENATVQDVGAGETPAVRGQMSGDRAPATPPGGATQQPAGAAAPVAAGVVGAVPGGAAPTTSTDPQLASVIAENQQLRAEITRQGEQSATTRAQLAAMARRESRVLIANELRDLRHPTNPRARLAPQLAEAWAELLCDVSDAAPQLAADVPADDPSRRSPRRALRDLIAATAAPWPEFGERGFDGTPPADGSGMTAAQKSVELDKLAQAKVDEAVKAGGALEYKDAVMAVASERKDLVA